MSLPGEKDILVTAVVSWAEWTMPFEGKQTRYVLKCLLLGYVTPDDLS